MCFANMNTMPGHHVPIIGSAVLLLRLSDALNPRAQVSTALNPEGFPGGPLQPDVP